MRLQNGKPVFDWKQKMLWGIDTKDFNHILKLIINPYYLLESIMQQQGAQKFILLEDSIQKNLRLAIRILTIFQPPDVYESFITQYCGWFSVNLLYLSYLMAFL